MTTTKHSWTVGLLAALVACGGSGGPSTLPEREVLFDGPPGELLPHAAGDTSGFIVTARSGDETISAAVTTTVLSDGPEGEFIVESTSDGGAPRRVRARESEDRIQIEARATATDGFGWREVDPPAIVVRTPVIAGRSTETPFVRTTEILLEVDGVRKARAVTFAGQNTRTARAWRTIEIQDGEIRALEFDVEGVGEIVQIDGRHTAAGPLQLRFRGTEYRVPRIGLLLETMELTFTSGDASAVVFVRTERAT